MKKKTKSVLLKIPLHIYPFDVLVSIGHDDNELKRILKRNRVPDLDIPLSEYGELGAARYCLFPVCNLGLIRIKKGNYILIYPTD